MSTSPHPEIHEILSRDHERLDALLAAALTADGAIDETSFAEFRRGLLRHIGIEERVLFPELRRVRGATDIERLLHRDHATLAALLVPPPSKELIEQIRAILVEHNPLEEDAGGMYEIVEQLPGVDAAALAERVRAYPEVPTAPYCESETIRSAIERLLRERR